MKNEVIFGAIGIILGALMGYYVQLGPGPALGIFLIFLLGYLMSNKDLSFALLALGLGIFLMVNRQGAYRVQDLNPGYFTGIIEEPMGRDEGYSSYLLRLRTYEGQNINERVILNLSKDSNHRPGDYLGFYGRPSPIQGATNTGLFDYRTYMGIKGVQARIKTHSLDYLGHGTSALREAKEAFRAYVGREMNWGMDEFNGAFMTDAIINSSSLNQARSQAMADLGLSHILAISGLHIGIIWGILAFVFARLGVHKYVGDILIFWVLALYTYMIGFPASAIRALIMIGLGKLATMVKLAYSNKKALAASVFLMVLVNPYRVFDVGMVLSCLAVLGLIYMNKIFTKATTNGLALALRMSFVVNLFIFPFILRSFNSFNLLSFLANVLIVPLFTLSLVAGIIKLALGLVFPGLSWIMGAFINTALNYMWVINDFLHGLDFFKLDFRSPGLGFFVLYYFIIFLYIKRYDLGLLTWNFKRRLGSMVLVQVLACLVFNLVYDPLDINFIDIGQGDAIHISYRGKDLLIDTGGGFFDDSSYSYSLKPYLTKATSGPLPVIISHRDLDHMGNLQALEDDGFVTRVYGSSHYLEGGEVGLRTGDRLDLAGPIIEVIHDGRGAMTSNDSSLILRLTHHGRRVLFTGDSENQAESMVLDKDIGAQILKVGHHGSKSSTGQEFLQAVSPDYGIISVGRDNTYGHPHEEVLNRLERMGVGVYRTDQDGLVRVRLSRLGYDISSYLPRQIGLIEFLVLLAILALGIALYYRYLKLFYENRNSLWDQGPI